MLSFIDIQTGNVYDGTGRIFWFDGEQSTDLIYVQKICFISTKKEVKVRIPKNEVFSLLDSSIIESGYVDYNELKVNDIKSIGSPHRNFYVHMIYVGGSSNKAGEVIEDLYIGDVCCKVGADFYDENESLYINLSNNGVNIPNSIQKAIYGANIYEAHRDNILMNRKWKELLSNLWDIVCNKGSYKSLINSLKWFEWGDIADLKEFWQRSDTRLEMTNLMNDRYNEVEHDLKKTTYISLNVALDKIIPGEYDEEKNPALQELVSKWSKEDLSLKVSILGSFYKTYFMPIHLDLLHSTIENTVFTNTFKSIQSTSSGRYDYVYNINELNYELSGDNHLGYVEAYVGPNTLFSDKWEDGKEVDIFGVDRRPTTFNVVHKPEKEHMYARTQTNTPPLTPDKITDLWTKYIYPPTREYPYSWECFRTLNEVTGEYGDWSEPVLIDMWESDVDPILEYRYKLTQTIVPPIDSNWDKDPQTVTSTYPYEWVSFRMLDLTENIWSDWSQPSLSSIYNSTTSNIEYEYALGDESGPKYSWKVEPQTTTSTNTHEWMRFRTLNHDGNWNDWSDPIISNIYNITQHNIEYQYTKTANTIPTESGWVVDEPELDTVNMYGWTRFRIFNGTTWSDWSDPVLIAVYKEIVEPINHTEVDVVDIEPEPIYDTIPNDMLINFANQYFKSVGSIIDFKLKPTFEVGDFTKRISIMAIYPNGKRRQMDEYKVFDKDINFSLLFKDVGEYELRVQVECISGRVLNTIIKFEIFDMSDVDITIYKVINNRTPDFKLLYSPHKINKFTFSRRIDDDKNMLFKQYIPTKVVDPRKLDGHNWRGVCLNHMYILEDKDDVRENNYINNHYHKISREIGDKKYIICISKRFGFVPKEPWVKSFRDKIYKDEYIFCPEFHTLYELGYEKYLTSNMKEDMKYYTVSDDDALCVVPNLPLMDKVTKYAWEFVNESTGEVIRPKESVKEPFISHKNPLTPGYYTVRFIYEVGGIMKNIEINSAFRKV